MDHPGDDKGPDEHNRGVFAEYGPYLTIGAQLALAVVIFFFLGRWLDQEFETTPWLTILGSAAGITGGLIKFIRTAIQMGQREDREHQKDMENKTS